MSFVDKSFMIIHFIESRALVIIQARMQTKKLTFTRASTRHASLIVSILYERAKRPQLERRLAVLLDDVQVRVIHPRRISHVFWITVFTHHRSSCWPCTQPGSPRAFDKHIPSCPPACASGTLHGLICKEDTDSDLVSGGEDLQKVGRGGQRERDYADAAFAWLVVGLGKNMLSMSETTSIVVSVLLGWKYNEVS